MSCGDAKMIENPLGICIGLRLDVVTNHDIGNADD